MSGDWRTIIERIKACRRLRDTEEIIPCLERLFEIERDGMVAFAIGEESEKSGDLEKALRYFEIAATLFPLEKYRNNARVSIDRIKKVSRHSAQGKKEQAEPDKAAVPDLGSHTPAGAIFVVACSKTKIWGLITNAPDFVPARFAYRGANFLKFIDWANAVDLEKKGFFWIILSGKYGFIEPWHPICNYDVYLGNPLTSISDETIKNQARQKRHWRDASGNPIEIYLQGFSEIICINCNEDYLEKIIMAFPGATIKDVGL